YRSIHIGRCNVTTGRCKHAVLERIDGVVDDILRQEVNNRCCCGCSRDRIGAHAVTDGDRILQLLAGHTYQLNVAQRERRTALNTSSAVDRPSTNQMIDYAIGTIQESLTLTDRQFIDEVGLERVVDVKR